MCEPTLIFSAAVGGAKAISGIQEQNRLHQAQKAAVARENAIARQDYLNKIQISAHNDQRKLQVYKAQLEALSASKAAYYKQRDLNQQEASRASMKAQEELQNKIEEAAFTDQTNLVEQIKAQGTVLASGMSPGQSMLLEMQDTERSLGFAQAQLENELTNYNQAFHSQQYEIALSQHSADNIAMGQIDPGPGIAPTASFMTIKPLKKIAPKKPSALGPILSGITTAVGIYGNTGYEGRTLFGKDTSGTGG